VPDDGLIDGPEKTKPRKSLNLRGFSQFFGGKGDRQNSFRNFPRHSIESSNIKDLMPSYYRNRLQSSGAIRHPAMG
jgi:hypothetical protein